MSEDGDKTEQVETLLATPDLASALESEQFRRFLDQVPIAIVVSEMKDGERIVYANPEFEKLSGQPAENVGGRTWGALRGHAEVGAAHIKLGSAIVESSDFVGTFQIERASVATAIV